MTPRNTLWTDVTLSDHAHERAALNFIRDRFPAREPFRAWSNFTFVADDSSMNEVDLLVVATTGVYLVEIKSHPGRMEGDAATWTWLPPDGGRERHFDNPLLLADRKAKRLKSLLARQAAFRGPKGMVPDFFIQPVIFLSDPTLRVALSDQGRFGLYGPDSTDGEPVNDLPGIMRLFMRPESGRRSRVDRPMSEALARAMDSAGVRESVSLRMVGQYQLGELLDEGEGWQDYEATHPQLEKERRRVRIYLTDRAVSDEEHEAQQKAAEREFRVLREFVHPGADRPLEFLPSDRGPALIFEWHPEALRLDHWLKENDERLTLYDRLVLLEDLAEIVREAHRQGIYHRALSPRTVRVLERQGKPTLRICDWQTALRSRSRDTGITSTSMLGTVHVAEHVGRQEHLYLAPEVLALPDPEALPADIWSLGALAVLILSGRRPAPDLDGVRRLLQEQGSLSLAAVMDAPDRELERLVRTATDKESHRRYVAVQDFLEQLNHALELMTQDELEDPLDARAGAKLEGGWKVARRPGSGSTSVVLIATHEDGREEALKVARSEDQAFTLQAEYETLSKLRDRSIIEAFGLDTIGGRTVLRLEVAQGTLGDALRKDGRLSLDLLERFGSDLLHALTYLDQEGIWHRDIKPDNLAIAERGKQHERRLVLLDFSLSGTDLSDLHIGTRGYLDPFLSERPKPRWDEQAERYAAGVTLYEMATGTRPTWGDGSSDPALLADELPHIDAALLDPAVRGGLETFFKRALHRDPAKRFDTAADMEKAWAKVFQGQEAGVSRTDQGAAVADLDLTSVTKKTLLSELELSPRIRDALERLGVTTAAELAQIPGGDLVRISGLGAATRTEVNHLARLLREHLAGESGLKGSVDVIAGKLVPGRQADATHQAMASAVLGLEVDAELPFWPSIVEAARVSGLTQEDATRGLDAARSRWSKTPELTAVRREIQSLLAVRGGIAGATELATLLLSARGSSAREPERSRRARAVVRAAVETESTLQAPSFVGRRLGGQYLVALNAATSLDGQTQEWEAERLVECAARLGEVAAELAGHDPLPERDEVLTALRDVELPEGAPPFSDARLVRVAAAAAEGVSVSAQLALYPTGMPAVKAVKESRAVLLNRRGLSEEAVRERIRSRFPEAEDLPRRPDLDHLLAPLGLEWNAQSKVFSLPSRGGPLSTMTTYRRTTLTTVTPPDEADLEVRALDERLDLVVGSGGFLALSVDMARLDRALTALTRVTGATHIDIDGRVVERVRDLIRSASGGDWSKVLEADAVPGERGWTRLIQVIRKVLPEVEEEILSTQGVVVVSGLGLLARYDQLQLIDRLRDAATLRAGSHPLRGLIVVAPSRGGAGRPTIDGKSIPVITANQWARIPGAWLHRHEQGEAA